MTARRLAHPPPPAPAKAIHAAEIATAASQQGAEFTKAFDDLVTNLLFPHSVWWLAQRGGTVHTASHTVTASLRGGVGALAVPAGSYQAGTGNTPTAADLTAKTLAVVLAVVKDQPLNVQRFVDAVLQATPTAPAAPPLPVSEPGVPAALPITKEAYASYVKQEASHFVDVVRWMVRRELRRRFLSTATRVQWGRCTAISTSAKTVTVQWDATDNNVAPGPETIAFGPRNWTTGQIVGKRVRVLLTPLGKWVDDIDVASGRA